MAAFTSAEYLANIRRILESAMVQLSEAGFDAPQFTDKSIYHSIPDAVDDVNGPWETEYEATSTDNTIDISPDPTRTESRAICLWTAFLLMEGWANLNLTDGSIGASYREGIASIDTRGQGVLARTAMDRLEGRAQRAIDRITLGEATAGGSQLPFVPADEDDV